MALNATKNMGLVAKNQHANGKWNIGFKSLILTTVTTQDKTEWAKKGKYKELKKQDIPVLSFFAEVVITIPVQGVSWQGLEWDEL